MTLHWTTRDKLPTVPQWCDELLLNCKHSGPLCAHAQDICMASLRLDISHCCRWQDQATRPFSVSLPLLPGRPLLSHISSPLESSASSLIGIWILQVTQKLNNHESQWEAEHSMDACTGSGLWTVTCGFPPGSSSSSWECFYIRITSQSSRSHCKSKAILDNLSSLCLKMIERELGYSLVDRHSSSSVWGLSLSVLEKKRLNELILWTK